MPAWVTWQTVCRGIKQGKEVTPVAVCDFITRPGDVLTDAATSEQRPKRAVHMWGKTSEHRRVAWAKALG